MNWRLRSLEDSYLQRFLDLLIRNMAKVWSREQVCHPNLQLAEFPETILSINWRLMPVGMLPLDKRSFQLANIILQKRFQNYQSH